MRMAKIGERVERKWKRFDVVSKSISKSSNNPLPLRIDSLLVYVNHGLKFRACLL